MAQTLNIFDNLFAQHCSNINGIIRSNIFPVFFIAGIILLILPGCTTSKKYSGFTFVRKYQKNIPFVFKNNISLTAPDLSSDEKVAVYSKLNTQLDASAKVKIKDVSIVFHYITHPPAFDPNAVEQSASNMTTAKGNVAYYNPIVD